jgi:5-methylcytosine-specific restriction endonuclease McrA
VLDKKQIRKEFNRVRRAYFKENPKVCSRCCRYYESMHLHHKIAVIDGGTNNLSNLIPL